MGKGGAGKGKLSNTAKRKQQAVAKRSSAVISSLVTTQVKKSWSSSADKRAQTAAYRERIQQTRANNQAATSRGQLLTEERKKQVAEETKAASKVKLKRAKLEQALKLLVHLVAKRSATANPEADTIKALFTLDRVPEKFERKASLIPLPHPLYDESSEVCFISKDPQTEYEGLLTRTPRIPGLTKVLGLDMLRSKFKSLKQKHTLADAYDLFLCDTRIVEMMPELLGPVFYEKKMKRPIAVKVTDDAAVSIQKAIASTALRVPMASSFGVKFGRCSMGEKELLENAAKVVAETVRRLSSENPVQSIAILAADREVTIWRRGEETVSADASATASGDEKGRIVASLKELETEGESAGVLDSGAGDNDDADGDALLVKSCRKRKPKVVPHASPKIQPEESPEATPSDAPKLEVRTGVEMAPLTKKQRKKMDARKTSLPER